MKKHETWCACVFVLGSLYSSACSRGAERVMRGSMEDGKSDMQVTPGVGAAGAADKSQTKTQDTAGASGAPVIATSTPTSTAKSDVDVRVEDGTGVTIEVLMLDCKGGCADLLAVAHGGNPPYTFVWDDGSTDASRHVCLTADDDLSVTVTDKGVTTAEFGTMASSATASVKADVLECEPPPGGGPFCVKNPSFEGTPSIAEQGLMLPEWSVCAITPDVNPIFAQIPASDGATYLGVMAPFPDLVESAGGSFCGPLQPGKSISFMIDLAVSSYARGEGLLEIWAGIESCARTEKLWTSPVVNDIDTWHSFCATVTPSQAFEHLVMWPVPKSPMGTGSYFLIDNIRTVESCP